ncbi:MAG: hypothetical protein WB777_24690 [Mycobacterium sp.]
MIFFLERIGVEIAASFSGNRFGQPDSKSDFSDYFQDRRPKGWAGDADRDRGLDTSVDPALSL